MQSLELLPPDIRLNQTRAVGLGPLQFFDRALQALRNGGQVTANQRVQCSRIAVTVRRGTQYVERLQQVLDVMCDLGAGLMQRVHVRLFPEGPLPQLRDVELREQLPEEVEMPHQRRAGTHLAVERSEERRV